MDRLYGARTSITFMIRRDMCHQAVFYKDIAMIHIIGVTQVGPAARLSGGSILIVPININSRSTLTNTTVPQSQGIFSIYQED